LSKPPAAMPLPASIQITEGWALVVGAGEWKRPFASGVEFAPRR
jgi:hypothetical protein